MASTPNGALRMVFMGTAGFAVPALEALAASRHQILCVYTQPPRPAGRGLKEVHSPVAEAALRLDLRIATPSTFKSEEARSDFAAIGADLGVVAAYGLLLPKAVLDAPRHGCVNIHASLLPRWRGASPIQHTILTGDRESGISIFQMEPSLDTGPVLARAALAVPPDATAARLHDALARLAADMIVPVVDAVAADEALAEPQPDAGITYAPKLGRDDGRLDWRRPADALERQVRAFTPWPGCWTTVDGERLRVHEALLVENGRGEPGTALDDRLTIATAAGALQLTVVQRQGGRAMPANDFLRGHPVPVGTRLG